ncbi:hypothetical protein OZX67_00610 [Bifidobacterium sp. ESL0728]|uniref:hypothetical protein n=1 Tax=Bifidobacterium sp. ESL0728 TaxID=2983220 RepID=UPI0023F88AE2|nr:hypothetical protein [Bifidobacterium sp. ESL0728]WEV59119.1 hypothetical protein OZX67_00610 [Bifidobacterium sp. ESL0728]
MGPRKHRRKLHLPWWAYLLVALLLDVEWGSALVLSHGFDKISYAIASLVGMGLSCLSIYAAGERVGEEHPNHSVAGLLAMLNILVVAFITMHVEIPASFLVFIAVAALVIFLVLFCLQ